MAKVSFLDDHHSKVHTQEKSWSPICNKKNDGRTISYDETLSSKFGDSLLIIISHSKMRGWGLIIMVTVD